MLTPPALMASFDLSAASREISLPLNSTPSLTVMVDFVLSTTTDTAPAMDTFPVPLTAPASDCAARRPLYSPSIFCVRSDLTSIFPSIPLLFISSTSLPVRLFDIVTLASFLSTLTEMPAAIEFESFARLMAIPVPIVLKLPRLSASMTILPATREPSMIVLALCPVILSPTAAATWNFCSAVL